jgi:anthranilate phosphoribosyltransferase
MKYAAPVRKELGIRTLFNILGPLTNPANAGTQLLGVFHPDLVGILVRVLQRLGSRRALVVHGVDGLDEISLSGPTMIGELKDGEIHEYQIQPEDFGIAPAPISELQVANSAESIARMKAVLANEAGPSQDIVLLNAGAALYAAGRVNSIAKGIAHAREAIASGAALKKLNEFIATTQTV